MIINHEPVNFSTPEDAYAYLESQLGKYVRIELDPADGNLGGTVTGRVLMAGLSRNPTGDIDGIHARLEGDSLVHYWASEIRAGRFRIYPEWRA